MTRIVVKELVLNEANLEHVKKHNISKEEILRAGDKIIYHKHSYSKRYVTISRSGSRIISLVLTRLGPGKYYLITARDSDKKERRRLYEKEKKQVA